MAWRSKQQATVALSSTEAEYVAASELLCELIYVDGLVSEVVRHGTGSRKGRISIPSSLRESIPFWIDNKGTICLTQNMESRRTKHIDIRHHFLREKVRAKFISPRYVSTSENTADCFTKGLAPEVFLGMRRRLRMA